MCLMTLLSRPLTLLADQTVKSFRETVTMSGNIVAKRTASMKLSEMSTYEDPSMACVREVASRNFLT